MQGCRSRSGKYCAEGPDRQKALRPPEKREAVGYLVAVHRLRKTRACCAMKLSRPTYYRVLQHRDDREVIDALNALVEKHPRWGFWLCFDALKLNGCP